MMLDIVNNEQFKSDFVKKFQETNEEVFDVVQKIKNNVLQRGDAALLSYLNEFDNVDTTHFNLIVSDDEISEAYYNVSPDYLKAVKTAKDNIMAYHEPQLPHNWFSENDQGVFYSTLYRPIENVALYVPGGRALYPSTVLMNAIPAKLAKVPNLTIVTPPRADGTIAPEILVAASECGVKHIIKSGGAQVIFALAYGTKTIHKTDKIVGPGNQYVDCAKQMVYGKVDIDKPAGPSEVCVYIEDAGYASYAAAELLAQLEHDPAASGQVISNSFDVLELVRKETLSQLKSLKRADIIKQSLRNAFLIHVVSENEAISLMNDIASEHLVLLVDDFEHLVERIHHAGAIFCGPFTPVALGDYIAGTNHVLPTAKAARFSSPLGVMDFMKFSSQLIYNKKALKDVSQHVKTFTDIEKLDGHYNSIQQRLNGFS